MGRIRFYSIACFLSISSRSDTTYCASVGARTDSGVNKSGPGNGELFFHLQLHVHVLPGNDAVVGGDGLETKSFYHLSGPQDLSVY